MKSLSETDKRALEIRKWDKAAESFDKINFGIERRYGGFKRELFSKCKGKTLLVAAGTGLDFQFFNEGLDIIAIDFSPKMVEKAKVKAKSYNGKLEARLADAQAMEFADESFDTVVTSCTFCSIPDPVKGFREIYRTLKPEGRLLMFEHVRPANFLLGAMMDLMTPISRVFGPNLNRRTADNARIAGFNIVREFNVYLDMVKLFEAVKGG